MKNNIQLTDGEPIIEVILQPFSAYVVAIRARNEQLLRADPKAKPDPIPQPVSVPALIDTGFTGGLMICESLIKSWQLKSRSWSELGFPRDGEERYFALYAWDVDIGIKLPKCSHNGGNVLIETYATMVEMVNSKNSKVLIGQQILQSAIFVYNGPKNYFTLTFPRIRK